MTIKAIPERIAYLTLLFIHKQLSPTERKELDQWILESEQNEELFDQATDLSSNSHSNRPKQKRKGSSEKNKPIDLKTFYRRRGII